MSRHRFLLLLLPSAGPRLPRAPGVLPHVTAGGAAARQCARRVTIHAAPRRPPSTEPDAEPDVYYARLPLRDPPPRGGPRPRRAAARQQRGLPAVGAGGRGRALAVGGPARRAGRSRVGRAPPRDR